VQTTWKHRQKAAKRQKVFTIGLAVFTFLCGALAGHWWSTQHSRVKQLTYELERTQFDLAQAKFALEKTSKLADIRHNLAAVVLQILDVYRKQSKLVEVADNNASKNIRDKTKRELEMMWKSAIPPLKDRLTQLESTLAKLENREPREFVFPALEPCIPYVMRR
jgi:hypothetical protein